jgi:hypothetical protein
MCRVPTRVMRHGVYANNADVTEDVCLPPGAYRIVSYGRV